MLAPISPFDKLTPPKAQRIHYPRLISRVTGTAVAKRIEDHQKLPPAKLLVVVAHPDDEILTTGTLAKYAGTNSIQMVFLSMGEGGHDVSGLDLADHDEDRYDRPQNPQLAWVRQAELAQAMQVLGIQKPPVLLRYPDARLSRYGDPIKAELKAIIQATRPEYIITFGPDGFTGHPDHVAAGKFTFDAVHELDAEDPDARTRQLPGRLYHFAMSQTGYQTFKETLGKVFQPDEAALASHPMPQTEKPFVARAISDLKRRKVEQAWKAIKPVDISPTDWRVELSPADLLRKTVSMASHRTQFSADEIRLFDAYFKADPHEYFRRLDRFA